jgi:hypothetical protein
MTKLKDAGYINVVKSFKGNYPHTACSITEKGIDAYEKYVNAMDEYFQKFKDEKISNTES